MKQYGLNELRKMFLDFFESKGHLVMKSFSLVPHNDNSLLLINAGMAPLKPYFTGQEIPPRTRVATCQKCIRTGDIENIGKTARHGTFFEMLGNFSFGDYFKREAIHWSWEFLTEVVGLEADRLYPSVYLEDDEAFDIWNKEMGIPAERIFKFGKEDNFWEHGAGPCGPCSEIYYDRGAKYGCGKPGCTVGCECDRYIEIWNNVFTQFENDGNGNYTTFKQKNIDTGMGLERLATVVQDVDSIFDVDTIKALRDKVCELANKEYKKEYKWDVSIRIVTDHIRSATFMISDGIMPSNEGRGYVLRRLIRRAARHGKLLGIDGRFLSTLSETVIESSKDGYPELEEKKSMIFKVLSEEENKFNKTIDTGLNILADMEEEMKKNNQTQLSGENAFKLYDTYGFPLDLTEEILEEKGFGVDEDGFKEAMEVQRKKARSARKKTNYMGADATVYEQLDKALTTKFVGYDKLISDTVVTALTTEKEVVQALVDGDKGTIVTEETPFYGTMGGQVGDRGTLTAADGEVVEIFDTKRENGIGVHLTHKLPANLEGSFKAAIDKEARRATSCNHTATHLLHEALREVLGTHVEQKGSFVSPDLLRFDFSHFQKVTPEELRRVEHLANRKVREAIARDEHRNMPIEEARAMGAMALFGEKYGDEVRVIRYGSSVELCGGTHVDNTGNIGMIRILSESSIAAGIRRIEAITGAKTEEALDTMADTLQDIGRLLNNAPDVLGALRKAIEENADLRRQAEENMKERIASLSKTLVDNAETIGGVKVVTMTGTRIPDMVKNVAFSVRNLSPENTAFIGATTDVGGKPLLTVMLTNDLVEHGKNASAMVREAAKAIKGGGGGQPGFAQAGGKDASGIETAFNALMAALA